MTPVVEGDTPDSKSIVVTVPSRAGVNDVATLSSPQVPVPGRFATAKSKPRLPPVWTTVSVSEYFASARPA